MNFVRSTLARLASLFRKSELDTRVDDEMMFHLEMQIEENVRRGMSRQEARRQARIAGGGLEQAKELHRDARSLPWVESVLEDVRYGVRTLRRDAGLSISAMLIVGLGVGASATVFSVVQALLLRPLPFAEPARLVWIANGDSLNLSAQTVQVNNLLDLLEQSDSFSDIAGFSPFYGAGDIRLNGLGEPERLTGVPVTETFFALLGLEPRLGRFFTAAECRQNAPETAVLSYRFWQLGLGSNPDIVGQTILLDGEPVTVVGVAPESFDFPGIFSPGTHADLFTPFPLSPEQNRQGNTLALIGRLKPGVELNVAEAEAAVIGQRLSGLAASTRNVEGGRRNGIHPRIRPLRDRVSGTMRGALFVLAGAVAFLMLLVCVNLSNLLLARAAGRRKEMAIRAALGAGRGRLIRQVFIESLLLSGCGAAIGLLLAINGTRLLSRIQDVNIPLLANIQVDGAAITFTLFAAVLTGLMFGLTPALQASFSKPQDALVESSRGSSSGLGRNRLRGSLVICEIALACILLTGAGLLVRSLNRVLHVELGFDSENVVAVRVDPSRDYMTRDQRAAYFDEVLAQARAVPGVVAAGLTDALPFGDNSGWRTWSASLPGRGQEHNEFPLVRIVDDSYLSVIRIPLRAGRDFTASDDDSSEQVVIINETLARSLWPEQDPLGQLLQSSGREHRVVGIVSEARYFALERESGPEMYLPIRQRPDYSSLDLVVRASRAPLELVPGIREALQSVDPNLPVPEFRTMEQLVDRSVFARRFVVLLTSGFAAFGLVLAALGIYGLISYSVTQRKQEIGIRMALGASAAHLQADIFRETLKLAAAGLTIGLLGSWLVARSLQGLLFEVTASDPVTFAAVLLVLTACAALAGALPARRAARLNPLDALRTD